MTVRCKGILVYNHGCSDSQFNNLWVMRSLLWSSIREAEQGDPSALHLDRSDCENAGLNTFKDCWGAIRST